MKIIQGIIILLLLPGVSKPVDHSYIRPGVERIIIINSFDAQSMKARNNKKLLFGELADSLRWMLYAELDRQIPAEKLVIEELINSQGNDSIYFDLIKKHAATKAIVIRDLNAYFNQTGVVVTRDGNSKDREASYDIVAEVSYSLYDDSKKIREFQTEVWEFFTKRNVISGLLAAGPDIVSKHKHAFKIVQKNAEQFVRELDMYLQSH
ncbi:MAG TPA: hypothetical protein VFP97_14815 [Chitinophagaceae bacterium]|nr:hypothetical protein [Chitinophagaceae bacterium]